MSLDERFGKLKSKTTAKSVKWEKKSSIKGQDVWFTTNSVNQSRNRALQEVRCPICSGSVNRGYKWNPTPKEVLDTLGLENCEAQTISVECMKNHCGHNWTLTVAKRKKSEKKSAPLPSGIPTITPQPKVYADRPPSVSEEQIQEIFARVVAQHQGKQKLADAMSQANKDFTAADQGEARALIKEANAFFKGIREASEQYHNLTWQKSRNCVVRTAMTKWSVTKKTRLSPLYSTMLVLLSESDHNGSLIEDLAAAAYHSVVLERRLPTKNGEKPVATKTQKVKVKKDGRSRKRQAKEAKTPRPLTPIPQSLEEEMDQQEEIPAPKPQRQKTVVNQELRTRSWLPPFAQDQEEI